jgi:hypothetical protein
MIARGARMAAAGLAMAVSAQTAQAQVVTWQAFLNGAQQVPPVNTPATGNAFGTLNVGTGLFTWNLNFTGLTSPTQNVAGTPAHLHGPALPGQTAGIILGFVGVPEGIRASVGTYTGSGTLTAEQVQFVLQGRTYVNLHTVANPMGEIRGQVTVTPEPTTWALLGTGLASVGLIARRRRAVALR